MGTMMETFENLVTEYVITDDEFTEVLAGSFPSECLAREYQVKNYPDKRILKIETFTKKSYDFIV